MAGTHPLGPIDFFSPENEVLLNPRMPLAQAERLREWLGAAGHLKGHVFVLTSGSTAASEADFKWVVLSKAAVLAAAAGSNTHLACTSSDVWLHCLPNFHVGGMAIWARAFLAQCRVSVAEFTDGWDAGEFVSAAAQAGATLASLVPAQVHDLVAARMESPPSLRAILVGAGALADDTYLAARELGWPLLRTYGMSEAASQVATEQLADLDLRRVGSAVTYQVLPHLEAEATTEGRLRVRGASLLSGYVSLDPRGKPHFWNPKDPSGWFLAEDLGEVEGRTLRLQGRTKDRIKIGGEIANLAVLRSTLDGQLKGDLQGRVALLALPDVRLEAVIGLAVEDGTDADLVSLAVDRFNEAVMPFERIRKQYVVGRIPRSELGKVKWGELLALLPAP